MYSATLHNGWPRLDVSYRIPDFNLCVSEIVIANIHIPEIVYEDLVTCAVVASRFRIYHFLKRIT